MTHHPKPMPYHLATQDGTPLEQVAYLDGEPQLGDHITIDAIAPCDEEGVLGPDTAQLDNEMRLVFSTARVIACQGPTGNTILRAADAGSEDRIRKMPVI